MFDIKPVSIQPKIPNIILCKWQAIGVVLALIIVAIENKHGF